MACMTTRTMLAAIPFPEISPEIFAITLFGFTFALRWYAMGYIVGIVIGWWIAVQASKRLTLWRDDTPPLTRDQIEDLLTWVIIGVIAGGRFGYVLFYGDGQFAQNPAAIFRIWDGGMSFHGGFIGVCVATIACARRYGVALGDVANILALTATPAILLVRIANFINAELWGRPTDLPWGVVFPGRAAQECGQISGFCARHPSQLYEGLLEGLILGALLLYLAWRRGAFKSPGKITGVLTCLANGRLWPDNGANSVIAHDRARCGPDRTCEAARVTAPAQDTPLHGRLVQQIARSGPMTIADFMATCLLHPDHGYYSTRTPIGSSGDFITAPEISQMFGEMLGLALAQAWMDQGAPDRVILAELGPPLFLVANEFFDALPIRQFIRDGAGWRERQIGLETGALAFGLSEAAPLAMLEHRLEDTRDGDLVELCPSARPIMAQIGQRISRNGGRRG